MPDRTTKLRAPSTEADAPDAASGAASAPAQLEFSAEQVARFLMATFVIAALLLRFWALDRQSMWYDEANGVRIAARTIPDIITELRADASPPLYYLVLHGWIAWLGTGEFAVRSLSAILGAAFVGLIMWTARTRCGRASAVLTGTLAAFSQFHLYYSQEARMYAMLTCFVALALAGALRAAERRRVGDWILYASGIVLAAYAHNYGLFVGLGTGLWLAARAWRAPALRRPVVLSHCAIVAAYLPWLPFAIRHQILGTAITGGWLPRFQFGHVVETLSHFVSMSMFSPSGLLFWLGVPAFALAFLSSLLIVDRKVDSFPIRFRRDPAVWLCVSVLLCGTALPMLVSTVRPIYLAHRYSIAVWPAFILLLGHGLATLRPRPLQAVTAGAIAAVCVAALGWHFNTMRKASDRDVARQLAEIIQPEDFVVFSPHWAAVSIEYYLGNLPHEAGFPMKTLGEREKRNEALERGRRTQQQMLELTRDRLETLGGRLVYVSMPWADYARELGNAYDQTFHLLGKGADGQIRVSVYQLTTPEPDRKDGQ